MKPALFEGVGVALATIFTEDGGIAVGETAELAARLVAAGVRGVVVAGSTGEAPALDRDERVVLLQAVRDAVPNHVPVVVGTGDVTTARAVGHTRAAVEAGADAVLVLSPPRVADPRPYYEAVRGAAGAVPVIGYHFPAMSAPGIDLELLDQFDVDGLKDSSGDAERLLVEAQRFGGALYTGAAPLLVHARAVGCRGAILALANIEPEACVAAFGGDAEAQQDLLPAHLASKRDFPHGLKRELHARYGVSAATRMG
ncbi:MAG: dihydrodipicolinate synthase family protein [Nitriliruptorales bacterium]|nr:dihydrodipicolinate synthase family protein [Nitriliruptorales bacterium]